MGNGDCDHCGHQAGTRETRDELNCPRASQHITDAI